MSVEPVPGVAYARPWTPSERHAGSTRHTVKRVCNGCGEAIGDAKVAEIQAAVQGAPLPDVRGECPFCDWLGPEAKARAEGGQQ